MRLFFPYLIGALFFFMTATANAAGTLVLETTKGEVRIALLETLAPNHVARIKELASDGFYNGIIFHRVIAGFMAQTGDPTGTGMGGSGQNLKAEFSDYAMNPDSADSQFFICFDGCSHLTGQYTVWGQVESGMDVIEQINIGEPPATPDSIIKASVEE
jgi:peptidylprolyl isomerase